MGRAVVARRVALCAACVVLLLISAAAPAHAHGGEESDEAADLVRQAIALAVNTPDDVDAIAEKVHDALEAKDRQGVDLDLVEAADAALEAGQLHRARARLERSIGARPHRGNGEPATIREIGEPTKGAEPGRAIPTEPLEGRGPGGWDGSDWAVLVGSLLVAGAGIALAFRYRPRVASEVR